jgi:hypothetical protein
VVRPSTKSIPELLTECPLFARTCGELANKCWRLKLNIAAG